MKREPRRPFVLAEPPERVARKLKAEPGVWSLVATGDLDRARVLAQTAYRIREGKLAAFRPDPDGAFEAISTADTSRAEKVADVELYARYLPRGATPD